jgi:four helix bundle protein
VKAVRDLSDRLVDFGAEVVGFSRLLQRTATGRHVAGQLVRSATSAGASYFEARGAGSRADFVHKLQLCLKELRETEYWLLLVERSGTAAAKGIAVLRLEADELVRILVSSVVKAKASSR